MTKIFFTFLLINTLSYTVFSQDWIIEDSTEAVQEFENYLHKARMAIQFNNDSTANLYKNTCAAIFYDNFSKLIQIRYVTSLIDLEENFYSKFGSDTTIKNWWLYAIGSVRLYDYYILRARLKLSKKDIYGGKLDVLNALKEHKNYPTPEGSEEAYFFLGLIQLKTGDKSDGCQNLSIAGEYGYAEAYEVIAKYCN